MRHEGELRQLAAQQGGYISSAQARACGLSSTEFDRLVSTDRWVPVTGRVLRLAGAPAVPGDQLHAALLDQGGDAAVAGTTSAWWWGLPGFSARNISLVTTSGTCHRTSLAVVTQIRSLPDRWVTTLRGVRVVRPELMALQLCAGVHPLRAERALDTAWRDGLLSGASLDRFLHEMSRSGRNGVKLLRELRAARDGDYTPPASNLERRAQDVLAPLQLDLVRQVDSGSDTGWTGRVDFRARRRPLIVEVQSEKFHSALLDAEADSARRAEFEHAGYEFVEITDAELWTHPEVARDRVARAVEQLRLRVAAS